MTQHRCQGRCDLLYDESELTWVHHAWNHPRGEHEHELHIAPALVTADTPNAVPDRTPCLTELRLDQAQRVR